MRNLFLCLAAGLGLLGVAGAQVAPVAPSAPARLQSAAAADLNSVLPQMNRVIENTRVDLAGLRVDKWKADSATKRQAETNIEALQRNMTAALPTIEAEVRANPGSVGAAFKLYRNVSALYDVLSSVAESAGAFGPREEYQAIAKDTANLDALRHSLADHVETMANAKDSELAQLQAQVRQARQAAEASAPPKKIIVDENPPAKKHVVKKKKKPPEEK